MKGYVFNFVAFVLLVAPSIPLSAFFYGDASDNFIIRWAFQDMCDHIFDPRTSLWSGPTSTTPGGVRCNPDEIQPGDLVFVRDIDLFMKVIHPKVNSPYVIITHGESRDTCREDFLEYLEDEKIIAWFSIHPPKYGHEKFYPLPLGLTQEKKYYHEGITFNRYLRELRENSSKTKLLYMNIADEGNPERKGANKILAFQSSRITETGKNSMSFEHYLEEMADYKFALAPRGWGPDCNRTWEALLVGTIPIVRRCQFDEFYYGSCSFSTIDQPECEDHYSRVPSFSRSQLDNLYEDMPILVIDNWSEITEELLHKKYEEILSRKYDLGMLYMEYWQSKIVKIRDDYLRKMGLPQVDSSRKLEKEAIFQVDPDAVEAEKVLANLTLDYLGESLREKVALQSKPIQKIETEGDCNYYLLRFALDPEDFYILYYDQYFGGELLLIIQTDLDGHPIGKAKIFLPDNMGKVGEVNAFAYINKIIILNPECRGLGYGSNLFKVGMDLLRKRNISKVILSVLDGTANIPALKLYAKNGFQFDPNGPSSTYHMYKILDSHN